ncbi:hypothetical protein [uncultured Sphingomonas sp.]|uniref:hypothetical protein n=1 Tax=uncultured Sphingomonas sp. TaxID=158754 RepID=UPI0030F4CF0C
MSAAQFERAVARAAARGGVSLAVEHHREIAWHSATFSGARHHVIASATDDETLDAWLATLDRVDLGLPGQMLADLRVAVREPYGDRVMLRLEGVTVACDLSAPECGAASAREGVGRRTPPPTPA